VVDDAAIGVDGQGRGGQPELLVDLLGHVVLVVVGVLTGVGDDDTSVGVERRERVVNIGATTISSRAWSSFRRRLWGSVWRALPMSALAMIRTRSGMSSFLCLGWSWGSPRLFFRQSNDLGRA
jgi:hypothetical protein